MFRKGKCLVGMAPLDVLGLLGDLSFGRFLGANVLSLASGESCKSGVLRCHSCFPHCFRHVTIDLFCLFVFSSKSNSIVVCCEVGRNICFRIKSLVWFVWLSREKIKHI